MGAHGDDRGWASRLARRAPVLIGGLALLTAATLAAMGRSAICRCGRIALWTGQVDGPENSQQFADWYSLSHLVHGLLLYVVTRLGLPRWPWRARLVVAVAIEAAWEVLENSPAVIDRYRATTMALGYRGDSILNSLSDIGCMVAGFLLARRAPRRVSVTIAMALELLALAAIRDNLTLNVLMLIAPIEAIRTWQAG